MDEARGGVRRSRRVAEIERKTAPSQSGVGRASLPAASTSANRHSSHRAPHPRPNLSSPLLLLPLEILHLITTAAGLHTREVSRLLLSAYGPLASARPIVIRTSRQLLDALHRLSTRPSPPPHPPTPITSLDLIHASRHVCPRTLSALTSSLPHLRSLALPSARRLTTASLSSLAPLSFTLTSLDLCNCPYIDVRSLPPLALHAPLLRSLALPLRAPLDLPAFRSQLQALSALSHLSSLTVHDPHAVLHDDLTSALLSTAATHLPHLRALAINMQPTLTQDPLLHLCRLTALTSLDLGVVLVLEPVERLLGALASLTGLRRLHLNSILPTAQLTTLRTLSRLQTLSISVRTAWGSYDQSVDDVLAAAALHPLSSLHVNVDPRFGMNTTMSPQGLSSLLSLAPTLRSLHLSQARLPAALPAAAGRLPHLTRLALASCTFDSRAPRFHALAALTALVDLALNRVHPLSPTLCADVAPLTALTALSLNANGLAAASIPLLTALRSLRSLSLRANAAAGAAGVGIGPRCSALMALPFLQELDLCYSLWDPAHLTQLGPQPPRLRICRAAGPFTPVEAEAARQVLRWPTAELACEQVHRGLLWAAAI